MKQTKKLLFSTSTGNINNVLCRHVTVLTSSPSKEPVALCAQHHKPCYFTSVDNHQQQWKSTLVTQQLEATINTATTNRKGETQIA